MFLASSTFFPPLQHCMKTTSYNWNDFKNWFLESNALSFIAAMPFSFLCISTLCNKISFVWILFFSVVDVIVFKCLGYFVLSYCWICSNNKLMEHRREHFYCMADSIQYTTNIVRQKNISIFNIENPGKSILMNLLLVYDNFKLFSFSISQMLDLDKKKIVK